MTTSWESHVAAGPAQPVYLVGGEAGAANAIQVNSTPSVASQTPVAHRSLAALDGAYPPLSTLADWATNPASYAKARFFVNLVVKGCTALADDPQITLRPYVRNGTLVAAGQSASYTRPRLKDVSSIHLQKTTNDGAAYTDYSAEVIDNDAATGASLNALGKLSDGDWVVVGGPVPFCGAAIDMDAFFLNENAATMTMQYWNGAWASLTSPTDGTLDTGKSLAKNGQLSWYVPTDWLPSTINGITAYWTRLSFSATLSANVEIEELDLLMPIKVGIDLQADGDDVLLMVESQDTATLTGALDYSGSIQLSWR